MYAVALSDKLILLVSFSYNGAFVRACVERFLPGFGKSRNVG